MDMEENENQRLYREMYLDNPNRYLIELFLLSVSDEKPRDFTLSGSSELFETLNRYSGYAVEDFLEERYKNEVFNDDIEWASESGCFFCYTKSAKTVVCIVEDLINHFQAKVNKEEWERFKNNPEFRLEIIT
jgi:hypothetical protein